MKNIYIFWCRRVLQSCSYGWQILLGEKSSSLVQTPLRQATWRPYKAAERLA